MLSRARVSWLTMAITAALALPAVAQDSIVELIQKIKPAVVTVTVYDNKGEEDREGTGFYIKQDEVITNWHVIDGAAKITVRATNGTVYQVTKVDSGDEAADLAILKLKSKNLDVVPLKVTAIAPKEGERVVVIGSAGGFESSISDGIVSGIRDVPEIGQVIQITAPVSPGSSGSPVINLRGEVVGIVVAYYSNGQNINFAVAGEKIASLEPGTIRRVSSAPAGTGAGPASQAAVKNGIALMEKGDYQKALAVFQSVVKDDPDNVAAWNLIGASYLQMQDYPNAFNAFKKVVEIAPRDATGYSGLAISLVGLGQYEIAMKAYQTAIMLEPDSAFPHYGLGMLYVMLGDKSSALDEYKVLQNLDPEMALKLFAELYPE